MIRWALVVGNPIDGIKIFGPFPSAEMADEYADTKLSSNVEWWIAEMRDPEE